MSGVATPLTDASNSGYEITLDVRNNGQFELWVPDFTAIAANVVPVFDPNTTDETHVQLDYYEDEYGINRARLGPGQSRTYTVFVPSGFQRLRVFVTAFDSRDRRGTTHGKLIEFLDQDRAGG